MSGYPQYNPNPNAPYIPPMANSGFVQPGSNQYPASGFAGGSPYPAAGSPYPPAQGPYPSTPFGGAGVQPGPGPAAPYVMAPAYYPDQQTTMSQASVYVILILSSSSVSL